MCVCVCRHCIAFVCALLDGYLVVRTSERTNDGWIMSLVPKRSREEEEKEEEEEEEEEERNIRTGLLKLEGRV